MEGDTERQNKEEKRSPKRKSSTQIERDLDPIDLLHTTNTSGKIQKKLKDDLLAKGIKIRKGKWTREEDELLTRNWNKFLRRCGITDPELIILRKHQDKEKAKEMANLLKNENFLGSLAKGLDQRTVYQCYQHARKLFHPHKKAEETYSTEEIEHLKDYHENHGSNWVKIGMLMEKLPSSVECQWRKLERMKKEPFSGKWNTNEEAALIKAIKKVTKKSDIDGLYNGLPWKRIAGEVPHRNDEQCRNHWLQAMGKRTTFEKRRKFSSEYFVRLIRDIYELEIDNEYDIDWEELHKDSYIDIAPSPSFLRKRWNLLKAHVPQYKHKTFDEIREYLFEKYGSSKVKVTFGKEFKVEYVLRGTKDRTHTTHSKKTSTRDERKNQQVESNSDKLEYGIEQEADEEEAFSEISWDKHSEVSENNKSEHGSDDDFQNEISSENANLDNSFVIPNL